MLLLTLSTLMASAAWCATATNIYVSSYDGNLTTLSFSEEDGLAIKYRNPDCKTDPVWLQLDAANRVLYCLDEGNQNGIGGAITFNISDDGELSKVQRVDITPGPVSSIFYNAGDNRGMAIAHYGGSAVTALNVSTADDTLSGGQTFKFTDAPGPLVQQDAPHPHEVILDPTGKFIAVPDLGADLVRIFSIDSTTNLLSSVHNVTLPAGTGPRHGVFWSPVSPWDGTSPLYLFVLAELTNTITTFKVTYPSNSTIQFQRQGLVSTFGTKATPAGAAGAEIAVCPDNKFIIASNRNDSSFSIPNFDPTNSTEEVSDSLAVFAPQTNGTLSFVQLAPAGGLFPRQFQINKAGDKLVTGLQRSARVVVIQRDVATGTFGDFLANITVPGQVTTTLWDE